MFGKTVADMYDYIFDHYSNKTAVIHGKQRITFSELHDTGLRLINALLRIGLNHGDRLAILLPNCPEVFNADYACFKMGVAKIPIAPYLETEDIIFQLRDSGATAVLYDESFCEQVETIRRTFPKLIYVGSNPQKDYLQSNSDYHLQTLIKQGSHEPYVSQVTEDDLCVISYTGGTTGKPKGVTHSNRTIVAMLNLLLIECGIERNEVYLACTPLTHGAAAWVIPVFLRGGRCVVMEKFEAEAFMRMVEQENVTTGFIVPTMIYSLLDHPKRKSYDLVSLRNLILSAAPISPSRLKEAIEVFGPVITQMYGQVECPAVLAVMPKEDLICEDIELLDKRTASCGRPGIFVELKIVDESGKEVSVGERGEVVVKGPHMMLGYWGRPDLTTDTIRNGWLHTGDIAWQDEDGYLYIVDRKKEMIISGGFNIFPKEIEDVLVEHPAVFQAVVVGVPHPRWGEEVKAIVQVAEQCEVGEDELIAWCRERKGRILVPKTVDFVSQVPLTPLGKPDRKAARAQYWKDEERSVR